MNISKIATGVVNSISNNIKPTKLIGLDYSDVDDFIKTDFSKSAIAIAAKEGKLTQDMVEQMILQRLPRTMKQAEMFSHEHPEFCKEDVTQDLIEHVINLANEYKGQSNGDFNHYFITNEKHFLERLLKANNEQSQYFVSGMDFSQIPDDFVDKRLQASIPQSLSDAMDTLGTKEQFVLEARYGIDCEEPVNIASLARSLGTTREVIRGTEDKALRNMRHPKRARMPREIIKVIANGDFQDKMAHLADIDMLTK